MYYEYCEPSRIQFWLEVEVVDWVNRIRVKVRTSDVIACRTNLDRKQVPLNVLDRMETTFLLHHKDMLPSIKQRVIFYAEFFGL